MKKAICIVALLLLIAMLAVPVGATTGDSVDSVKQEAPTVGVLNDSTKSVAATTLTDTRADQEIKSVLTAAVNAGTPEMLAAALDGKDTGINTSNLVIRDLFYISVNQDDADEATLNFGLNLESSEEPIPMTFDGSAWNPVNPEDVVFNEDGSVDVKVTGKGGVIAFVMPGSTI